MLDSKGVRRSVLLERVGNQCQDFLILIQQQTCSQVSQTFVGESRGGEELQAFDLSKMGSLSKGEQVE